MADKQVEFLPFHVVNEFMRPDYRLTVVRDTLTALPKLPNHFRAAIDKLIKKNVRVAGFRDSTLAPTPFKIGPVAEGFEKSPELAATILSAWAETKSELRTGIYELLKGRGWELLPPEADRTKIPGFLTTWPNKDEDFDMLNKAYAEAHPGEEISTDDVSLMVVWLSGRLPYPSEAEAEGEEPAEKDNEITSAS